MKTSNPLTEHSFEQFTQLRETADLYYQAIEDRLNYIFHTIFESCGAKLVCWWVDGAAEGEVGDIRKIMYRDYICFGSICNEARNTNAENFKIVLDGETWDLLSTVPKHWLFETFEKELIEGLELYRNKLKQRKLSAVEKRKANKQRKEELIKSARNKLTAEEQKAVGIYKK